MTIRKFPDEVQGNTFSIKFASLAHGDVVRLRPMHNLAYTYFTIDALRDQHNQGNLEDLLETVFAAYELALARRVSP